MGLSHVRCCASRYLLLKVVTDSFSDATKLGQFCSITETTLASGSVPRANNVFDHVRRSEWRVFRGWE